MEVLFFWRTVCITRHANVLGITDLIQRLGNWWASKKPVDVWFEILRNAKTYEEWEEAAFQLDVLLGNDLWFVGCPISTAWEVDTNKLAKGARIQPRNITTTG